MTSQSPEKSEKVEGLERASERLARLPGGLLWLLAFAAILLTHWDLLRLPYFWDEGGYYIPAALDFYRHGWLIPVFTNAHPPLPNVLIGTWWHITGFHILATRVLVCAVAATCFSAVFVLAKRLLSAFSALSIALLTAVYPIWFAQSTLAHADIFAAAFTLWALAVYLPLNVRYEATSAERWKVAMLFSLAALSKETAILQPAALLALEGVRWFRERSPERRREGMRWMGAMAVPFLPLIAWYVYHRARTGFTFGNPTYLRYNATANLSVGHVFTALRYRFLHLFWQRNIWLPIVLALACLLLPRRPQREGRRSLSGAVRTACLVLIAANWVAFSVLGGALLTRYLLPIYPLILLLCVDLWQERTEKPWAFTAATAAVFLSGLWINPSTSFAPEDTLTYRDMIVVHQEAIAFVNAHYPDATVLTAWPVSMDLFNPELGYTNHRTKVVSLEDFSAAEVQKAAAEPERYDTAVVFTTHYLAPSFRRYLETHPNGRRGRDYAAHRDLKPAEIARMLHGQIVWMDDRNGEWAAVLRFNRSYEARLAEER
ncbi:MAG TPA: glycosyltransferase family 39 protein [Acidobacteriaceae bacterium]|nr:glycosyltransferase family 39 protein [Acidobacteriaceae bacterium]